jgi:hypothetical protein
MHCIHIALLFKDGLCGFAIIVTFHPLGEGVGLGLYSSDLAYA